MARKPLQLAGVLAALLLVVVSAGLATRQPWATPLWPWLDGRLTYWFVASIVASMAVAIAWISISGHWRAGLPGTVNVCVSAGAMSLFLTGQFSTAANAPAVAAEHSAVLGLFALGNLALFFVLRRTPLRGQRRMPLLVYVSFLVFALVLLAVGGALVLGAPNVMPWPLQPRSAVLVGWIFLGDALYFLLPLWRPVWTNACAPLLSFLTYDLILLPPLLSHFSTVTPEHQASLHVYVAVLAYSAVLSAYYLLINPTTRAEFLPPWRNTA